jgi:hypothetical protein
MIRRFNRYELKYLIPGAVRDAMIPSMLGYMQPDREGGPDGAYAVTSLYYDTFDLSCYRAKIDGINYRRKLRIRRYGAASADRPVMVEIKQRINRTTQKRRLALPLDRAYALCDGGLDERFEDPLDQSVAEEVAFLVGARQLGPKCVISYRRRAFVGSSFEPGLRITFDENLRVSDASRGLSDGAARHLFLRPDCAVLEVKSNDVVPLWVSRLLAAHSCTVVRYSKYCAGIARLRGLTRAGELCPGANDG